ncbi:MAG: aminopeptidase [Bacteroidetes bacterium]|nr:aminopeptidase [Bacteroidota bacterium]
MKQLKFLSAAILLFVFTAASAQTRTNKKDSKYEFTVEKEIGSTDVKNQGSTGTCWSFSALSFLEAEVKRMNKSDVALSEMFIARMAYQMKAEKYLRMMGKTNFSQGGAFHDVMNVIKEYGIVPRSTYTGLIYDQKRFHHTEMEKVLTDLLNTTLEMKEGHLNPAWKPAFNSILDAYLGAVPATVPAGTKSLNPNAYASSLGIIPDDYIEVSSFSHHPFYSKFVLEVPDNWAWNSVYNVPLDEFAKIIEAAISNGYTVAWAADVSEKGFSHKNGLAIVPDGDWENMSKEEREAAWNAPVKQKTITQSVRQEAFDNLSTQDDHGMQITGMAKDQNGTRYYIVKNSWGDESNECGGYFYCSEAYVLYKTTSIMVHKKALPADIAAKLGIK